MLPLGRRVEDKIQHLIDQHMQSLGKLESVLLGMPDCSLVSRSFEAFPLDHLIGITLGEERPSKERSVRGMDRPRSGQTSHFMADYSC